MGCQFEFRCPHCDYHVKASREPDRGMAVTLEYVTCVPCQAVVGVVAERHFGILTESDRVCPVCKQGDFTEWMSQALCPKCQHPMEQGDEAYMWD